MATLVSPRFWELFPRKSTPDLSKVIAALAAAMNNQRQAAQSAQPGARPRPVVLEVEKFGGSDKELAAPWVMQVSMAMSAQLISENHLQVAFAMSHLKGPAKQWAYTLQAHNPNCFSSFDSFLVAFKANYMPPNSDYQYRASFLACKQGRLSVREYVARLRSFAAGLPQHLLLPEEVQVTTFMQGLNPSPVRNQLFREYPSTFEKAIQIALKEEYSQSQAAARPGRSPNESADMEVNNVERVGVRHNSSAAAERGCFNCVILLVLVRPRAVKPFVTPEMVSAV
jgi:hypothetical protein